MFFLLTAVQKLYLKIKRVFPELWSQMYCHVYIMIQRILENESAETASVDVTATLMDCQGGHSQIASPCQISQRSVIPLPRYRGFRFPRWWLSAILHSKNLVILLANRMQMIKAHQHVKFRQNRAIYCRDIAIFWFSKWRSSAILTLLCACLNHPRRAFGGVYYCAKFDRNRCSIVLIICKF